jgi:site-specific DNA-methyltransferase (adenine-specific)
MPARIEADGLDVRCGSYHNIFQLGFILQAEYDAKILNDIIWFKPNAQPNITARMFTQSTETLIWVAKQSGWKFNYKDMKALNGGKQIRNKWEIPLTPRSEKSAGDKHPSQKPLALLDRCLRATTDPGDMVLDSMPPTAQASRARCRRTP